MREENKLPTDLPLLLYIAHWSCQKAEYSHPEPLSIHFFIFFVRTVSIISTHSVFFDILLNTFSYHKHLFKIWISLYQISPDSSK